MRNSEFVDEAHIPDADFSIILSAEKMLKRLAAGLFLNSGWWICRSTEQFPPGHVHVFSCFRFRWICRFILMMSIRCYLHEICNYILLYYVNCVHMKIIIYIYKSITYIYAYVSCVCQTHLFKNIRQGLTWESLRSRPVNPPAPRYAKHLRDTGRCWRWYDGMSFHGFPDFLFVYRDLYY